MARTLSIMTELGQQAADFSLPNYGPGQSHISLLDFYRQPLLIMFVCNHCPFVLHIISQLVQVANSAKTNGLGVVAISSNDTQSYPQDGPEPMAAFAKQHGFEFGYCLDETQQVAKAYGAACTPDFFLYDSNHKLVYRGQFDAARPGNEIEVTGEGLQAAISALVTGEKIDHQQIPSVGCNIKWRDDNAPDYFSS